MADSAEPEESRRSRSRSPPPCAASSQPVLETAAVPDMSVPETVAAPRTPDPLRGQLEVLERKVDRLANDLLRTSAFFRNRQSLLDSRLTQLSAQLDALRGQLFVSPAARLSCRF